jgi:hypothetical protein
MRQTNLRRLEALEEEHRSRERNHDGKELPVTEMAKACVRIIILAYYVGGLQLDVPPDRLERCNISPTYSGDSCDALEAFARALQYPSAHDCFVPADTRKELAEWDQRINDASGRLFANVGLDVHKAAPNELREALATILSNLPERWLDWLKCTLQKNCGDDVIADGSNLSRLFFVGDNTALG